MTFLANNWYWFLISSMVFFLISLLLFHILDSIQKQWYTRLSFWFASLFVIVQVCTLVSFVMFIVGAIVNITGEYPTGVVN